MHEFIGLHMISLCAFMAGVSMDRTRCASQTSLILPALALLKPEIVASRSTAEAPSRMAQVSLPRACTMASALLGPTPGSLAAHATNTQDWWLLPEGPDLSPLQPPDVSMKSLQVGLSPVWHGLCQRVVSVTSQGGPSRSSASSEYCL